MPQLDVSTYSAQLFWMFTCLIFLFVCLKSWILPRLQKQLHKRLTLIQEHQAVIDSLRNDITTLQNDLHKMELKFEDDLHQIIHKQTTQLETNRHAMLSHIEDDIRLSLSEFNRNLENQRLEIIGDLTKMVPDFSKSVREMLLDASVKRSVQ